ncbi:hypothetical protein SPRG_08895 [Saprolegnia parasitica CBS 223.65]|uniref:Uncharacterized protein n=1 Tax=Saprolegnia parasitica (strain CBS 223.65) TaxID=695850 RepID=A0A067CGB7_SAPPC|nr:hypothetical protein SPRG_08895 [Saprolegnia parasitica CBS 223.65]KDO25596.1 hypothetical protein SPRG_08895 [Saprolegnia parasitica CBS 223.65]|eukprot:XP_012203630.1 hypothetical protein SPRG_08895 [Saprolegnia parasitica CBS 223.65]
MSVDPILLADRTPMLVSPFERFDFVLSDVKFTVTSGSGYPGEGGVYVGSRGRLFLSSYRLVYVELDASNRHFRSFSLPLYAIYANHQFRTPLLGRPTYEGVVAPVPGGGLVGHGRFKWTFLSVGFDEFQSFYTPAFAHSRALHASVMALENPSIVQVPGAEAFQRATPTTKLAFCNPTNPFTLFVLRHPVRSDNAAQDTLERVEA